jgi:hypothetical protein
MGVDLIWTFVSHHVQPLWCREMPMWMHPGPSCSDHSFSVELGNAEIDAQIGRILIQGVHQNFGSSLIPLREGVVSPCVSPLKLILV